MATQTNRLLKGVKKPTKSLNPRKTTLKTSDDLKNGQLKPH